MPSRGRCAPAACRSPAPGGRDAAERSTAVSARDSKDLDGQLRYFAHVRRDDAVAQHADAGNLELDHVAVLHEAPLLVAAAAADRARAEDLAGDEGFLDRGVGDDVGKAVLHLPAPAVGPGLAVDARLHAQVLR